MRYRFVKFGAAAIVALACGATCCNRSIAAEPAVNADSYSPQLMQPTNSRNQLRVAQINPPPPGTAQSAQPGQSTIPPATSTPAGTTTTTQDAAQLPPGTGLPAPTIAVPVQVLPPQQVIVPGQTVNPPAQVFVPQGTTQGEFAPPAPLLEGGDFVEELPIEDEVVSVRDRGVRPYGGGHPYDWPWGCGGSPYRTNGRCDNWRVGPDWAITINGMVMSREDADLDDLLDEMEDNHQGDEDLENPVFEQFSHGPGGRITLTSQLPHYSGYQIQAAYEGIEAWNSSIVFELEDFEPEFFTAVITTTTVTDTDTITDTDTETTTTTTTTVIPTPADPNNPTTITTTTTVTETETETDTETETETTITTSYAPGPIPLQPGDPFPEGFEQRSLHYRSNYHSGELNFLKCGNKTTFQPYCGVRYIKFDDEINDFTNQEVQPPLPFEGPDNVAPGEFLAVASTDRLSLFDIENNLMGFQIGLMHDSWKLNRRLSLEGFVNSGLYYNKIKYTNLTGIFTTQQIADDTSTVAINEQRTDFSDVVNNDVRDLSEISYTAQASLSAVCRLNKCWALRAGYQGLWVANVHLAEDAYLDGETEARDLFFHGWHAGIECRR